MKYLRRRRPTRNPFDIIREMEEAAEKNRSIKLQGDDLLQAVSYTHLTLPTNREV